MTLLETIGRLTVIAWSHRVLRRGRQHSYRNYWVCVCSCGNTCILSDLSLSGNHPTKSCGCLRKEVAAKRRTTHGLSESAEYNSWRGAKERCTNPKNKKYKDYGGRGVQMCERWLKSFDTFLSDMGRKPTPAHTLERKDNNGNYEPKNCKWATRSEQMKNRRPRVSKAA